MRYQCQCCGRWKFSKSEIRKTLCTYCKSCKPEKVEKFIKEHAVCAFHIYVIWTNSICLYVGKSKNCFTRAASNAATCKKLGYNVTNIEFIQSANIYTTKELEMEAIKMLKPLLNTQHSVLFDEFLRLQQEKS